MAVEVRNGRTAPAHRQPPAALVRGALRLRGLLSRVRRRVGPAAPTIVESALALADTQALRALAAFKIPDQLARGPRSSTELATACGADARALSRSLGFAASRGLLGATRDGRFRNNRVSDLLRADHPMSLRDLALFAGSAAHFDAWKHTEDAIRGGTSAAIFAFDQPFFDMLEEDPELGAVFDGAMESLARLQAGFVARRHDFSDAVKVCDVGGGTGTLLVEVLSTFDHLRGTLFDVPAVAEKARDALTARLPAGRFEVVGGDFFDRVPAGADRYLLQSVLHDWDDEAAMMILANTLEAMARDGRILVIEQVLPAGGGEHPTRTLDLEMLVLNGAGHERSDAEYRSLFADVGLRIRATTDSGIVTMFELVPA